MEYRLALMRCRNLPFQRLPRQIPFALSLIDNLFTPIGTPSIDCLLAGSRFHLSELTHCLS